MLELFQRILEDQELNTVKDSPAADLKKLIEYILRKFFKAVKANPFLLVEVGPFPSLWVQIEMELTALITHNDRSSCPRRIDSFRS